MQLSDIKGLGPKTLECLKNLNIYNIDDLVNYYKDKEKDKEYLLLLSDKLF